MHGVQAGKQHLTTQKLRAWHEQTSRQTASHDTGAARVARADKQANSISRHRSCARCTSRQAGKQYLTTQELRALHEQTSRQTASHETGAARVARADKQANSISRHRSCARGTSRQAGKQHLTTQKLRAWHEQTSRQTASHGTEAARVARTDKQATRKAITTGPANLLPPTCTPLPRAPCGAVAFADSHLHESLHIGTQTHTSLHNGKEAWTYSTPSKWTKSTPSKCGVDNHAHAYLGTRRNLLRGFWWCGSQPFTTGFPSQLLHCTDAQALFWSCTGPALPPSCQRCTVPISRNVHAGLLCRPLVRDAQSLFQGMCMQACIAAFSSEMQSPCFRGVQPLCCSTHLCLPSAAAHQQILDCIGALAHGLRR